MEAATALRNATHRRDRSEVASIVERIASKRHELGSLRWSPSAVDESIRRGNALRPWIFALTVPFNEIGMAMLEEEVFVNPRFALFEADSRDKPRLRPHVEHNMTTRKIVCDGHEVGRRPATPGERLASGYFWINALQRDVRDRLITEMPDDPIFGPVYRELQMHLEYKRFLRCGDGKLYPREEPVKKIFDSFDATNTLGWQLAALVVELQLQNGLTPTPQSCDKLLVDNKLVPALLLINNLVFSGLEWIWKGCNEACASDDVETIMASSPHAGLLRQYTSETFSRHSRYLPLDDKLFGLYGDRSDPQLWVSVDVGELIDVFTGERLMDKELWETFGCPGILGGIVRRHMRLLAKIYRQDSFWGKERPGFILASTSPVSDKSSSRKLPSWDRRGRLLFDELEYWLVGSEGISERTTEVRA